MLTRTDRIGDASYLAAQLFYEFAMNLGGYDGNLSFGIDAFGEDDAVWVDNDTVVVNADTGEYSVNGEVFTEFAKVADSV